MGGVPGYSHGGVPGCKHASMLTCPMPPPYGTSSEEHYCHGCLPPRLLLSLSWPAHFPEASPPRNASAVHLSEHPLPRALLSQFVMSWPLLSRYHHRGSFAYVGKDKAVMDSPLMGPVTGVVAMVIWKVGRGSAV